MSGFYDFASGLGFSALAFGTDKLALLRAATFPGGPLKKVKCFFMKFFSIFLKNFSKIMKLFTEKM